MRGSSLQRRGRCRRGRQRLQQRIRRRIGKQRRLFRRRIEQRKRIVERHVEQQLGRIRKQLGRVEQQLCRVGHSDCVDAGVNGRCVETHGGAITCYCTSDMCADDGACAGGQTCACHGAAYSNGLGNHCVTGNCRVDSDCGAGGWCSPTIASGCGGVAGYYCHTAQDQCVNDTDCGGSTGMEYCQYDTTAGYWSCQPALLCG